MTDQIQAALTITPLPEMEVRVPIVGITPLIVHRFTAKLGPGPGAINNSSSRVPEEEYERCFYRLPDGRYGFPLLAFKAATVSACRFYTRGVSMKLMKQALHFIPENYGTDNVPLVPIVADPPIMREDKVKVGMGAQTRYRPQFSNWRAVLPIRFITSSLTLDSLCTLIDVGGERNGIGEWRPEKGSGGNSGIHGCFRVDPEIKVEIVPPEFDETDGGDDDV